MSWVTYTAQTHFPIQNLPFGVFSSKIGGPIVPHCASAIGDFVVDLYVLADSGLLEGVGCSSSVFMQPTLNDFMETPSSCWRATRARLTELLGSSGSDSRLKDNEALKKKALVPMSDVQMHLPAKIGDYTDFYSSRDHATNVGIMIRGKDNALQPNWLHLPVGYHGRASSVVVSGTDVSRPAGQLQVDKTDASKGSSHGPCRLMDFELEMAFFVGGKSNPTGVPVSMEEADDRIFGAVIMNDWSARDVQTWEYVPLGPFTSKNFATSISPWCVSIDALKEFACASSSGAVQGSREGDPTPLPYITDPAYSSGLYDVNLEITLQGADDPSPSTIANSNLKHMYWNFRQQLVHHSVTGCPMNAGDLLGTGTISGPEESALGCMLELSWRGTRDVQLANGVEGNNVRKFLKDGDTVNMIGYAQGDGYRIGFGECKGKVLPAGMPSAVVPPPPATVASGAMNKYSLYSYWRSTSSWRVRIVLAIKGLDYNYTAVDLSKLVGNTKAMDALLEDSDLPQKNPLAQVPLLVVENAAGKTELSQSMAIMAYLEDAHPEGPSIFPADALAKAKANQIAEIINSGVQPLQNLGVLRSVTRASLVGTDEEVDGRGFAKSAILKGLAVVEALIAANCAASSFAAPFAAGTTQPTIADICLVPQVYNAGRFGVDMAAFPSIQRVVAQCADLPAFKKAAPEAQPDAQA